MKVVSQVITINTIAGVVEGVGRVLISVQGAVGRV
jgi:hypothetical protein